jgi:hypothetical protein
MAYAVNNYILKLTCSMCCLLISMLPEKREKRFIETLYINLLSFFWLDAPLVYSCVLRYVMCVFNEVHLLIKKENSWLL